jgi:DNA-binding MarR family transcriptional regulator
MKKMPDPNSILDFIQRNPGCNREQLRSYFYETGAERGKLFSHNISIILQQLKEKNKIRETDIARGRGSNIIKSKLFVNGDNKVNRPKIGRRGKQSSENRTKETLRGIETSILLSLDSEKTLSEIQSRLSLPKQTIFSCLKKLEALGLITKNTDKKTWKITSNGEGKVENIIAERYSSDDDLFFQLPFLINAGERFGIEDLLERTNSYYGFYFKHGISQEEAAKDFKNKLENTLRNPFVAPYIQKIRFKYEVVCSEEKLLLWRLYSMLNTVLYKSEKNKMGFGTAMYDQLIYLLKDNFGSIEAKIRDLPQHEQFWIWLMYNGTQLETLLPKIEIINQHGEDFREKLEKRGIPIKIHYSGKENETTMIEE